MYTHHVLIWLLVLGGATGCASTGAGSGGRSACSPVPPDERAGLAQVYRRCEVDTAADQVRPGPRPDFTPRPNSCVRADLTLVVDSTGKVVNGSSRVVRSNDPAFASAVQAIAPMLRYTPARKNGVPVAQLVEFGLRAQAVVTVSPAGTGASGRPRAAPSC